MRHTYKLKDELGDFDLDFLGLPAGASQPVRTRHCFGRRFMDLVEALSCRRRVAVGTKSRKDQQVPQPFQGRS